MYELSITKIKYPKNDTNIYEYSSLENLLNDLRIFILDCFDNVKQIEKEIENYENKLK